MIFVFFLVAFPFQYFLKISLLSVKFRKDIFLENEIKDLGYAVFLFLI